MDTELRAEDGHKLASYAAGPRDARRGLVVAQEIFGVNRHMRRVCDDYAAQGYAVVCPALFDRAERGVELDYAPADVARGRELRGGIDPALTVFDIRAAAAALPAGARRGIVGFCWGGTVAWHGATRTGDFGAAVGWYGGGVAAAKGEAPRCPVQLHFGETDASIPMADVEAVRAARPEVEIYVYNGAGHGFGCDERASYSPGNATLARRRTLEFLERQLAA